MAEDMAELYRVMDCCNGEIRLQAVRYGRGWYCMIVVSEQDDLVYEMFEDLVGGDNDYFAARDFFKTTKNDIVLESAEIPETAMEKSVAMAIEYLKS